MYLKGREAAQVQGPGAERLWGTASAPVSHVVAGSVRGGSGAPPASGTESGLVPAPGPIVVFLWASFICPSVKC